MHRTAPALLALAILGLSATAAYGQSAKQQEARRRKAEQLAKELRTAVAGKDQRTIDRVFGQARNMRLDLRHLLEEEINDGFYLSNSRYFALTPQSKTHQIGEITNRTGKSYQQAVLKVTFEGNNLSDTERVVFYDFAKDQRRLFRVSSGVWSRTRHFEIVESVEGPVRSEKFEFSKTKPNLYSDKTGLYTKWIDNLSGKEWASAVFNIGAYDELQRLVDVRSVGIENFLDNSSRPIEFTGPDPFSFPEFTLEFVGGIEDR